jgi:transcriptional regulator with XRE-family HTH domain
MALHHQSENGCGLGDRRKEYRSRGVFPDGPSLIEARKSRGLTQEQLAAIAEVDVKTIRKGESTQRLDVATLKRITAALGLELPKTLADQSRIREEHFAVIKSWQGAWYRRELQRLLDCYDPNAVLCLPGAPQLPFCGRHTGQSAIAKVCEIVWRLFASRPCSECEFFVAENPSQVVLRCCSQIITSRSSMQLTSTHHFLVKDLKVIEHHVEYDTLMMSQLLEKEKNCS